MKGFIDETVTRHFIVFASHQREAIQKFGLVKNVDNKGSYLGEA